MPDHDPLSLKQLAVFVALVEERSFTRAARVLGLSQSTVSGHIADLEKRLGLRLVERERSGVEPSFGGRALASRSPRRAGGRATRADERG